MQARVRASVRTGGGGANTSLRRIAIPDLYLELGDPLGKGIILGKRTRFQLHQLVHLLVSLTFIFLFSYLFLEYSH